MDGHDNDVDNTNNTNNSSQGIFSTPELTVDAEKITQNNEAAAESSRAKIASIFANTETGKQAQRLNDAMIANTAPATEDIVLDNGVKKRSKWPIVLAILALVAVVGGVVGYFVMNNLPGKTERETPLSLFQNYLEYAQNGPSPENAEDDSKNDINQDINVWCINDLYNLGLNTTEKNAYLAELNNRFDNFYNKNTDTELGEALDIHRQLLNTLSRYYLLTELYNNVLNKYLNDGDDVAQRYVDEFKVVPTDSDEDGMSVLSTAEQLEYDYLNIRLSVLRRYRIHDCIADNRLDVSCTLENTDFQTQQEEQSATDTRESLAAIIPFLQDDYRVSAEAILNYLEQRDA